MRKRLIISVIIVVTVLTSLSASYFYAANAANSLSIVCIDAVNEGTNPEGTSGTLVVKLGVKNPSSIEVRANWVLFITDFSGSRRVASAQHSFAVPVNAVVYPRFAFVMTAPVALQVASMVSQNNQGILYSRSDSVLAYTFQQEILVNSGTPASQFRPQSPLPGC